ncbi:bifunctional (p)ppGpp synthetase/guanosine-3',5'-bis(diphosphate) 3'-pyrophosphohydrolase [Suttonella sp. R2A3]|uniref:RelA/SpoT family protein n=1 Tax=Suttonella sp. R2A3 TaxID=2908648 RepID=UPI001F1C3904|nr:bifunctional (p)ppGpp synthetase/guanosine-3',5'-bis(diphosphate) 3'-pyrophosphohydrolase [Suttonella sp. R2A3]UJF25406.1 bifunctional (p)ppGpp synthetase/guanosine-3',5'-bis(diphosphate) 3'-pyrophosphohydrolase [Suttonella sp. R2A3]
MSTLRPHWLPGQAEYPDSAARELIERAYDVAATLNGALDEHTQWLIGSLYDLRSDATLIAAGLLVRPWRGKLIDGQRIDDEVDPNVTGLLRALDDLALIDALHEQENNDLEQLRKMLLAMASDMRAVVLKLALQTVAMRRANEYLPLEQQRLALQTRDLFAPLANRLGIAQLKWELEDRALRILEPDIYQELARSLEERRVDRERYITRIIAVLEQNMQEAGVTVNKIYGRVKHINSIYLKMKRKNLRFEQVNDVRAVRVEVESEEDCYQVLSIVNDLWQPIPEEFDDYIAHPKANGYQSLHCSLVGPEGRVLEVQIRTTKMHDHAELGVAAHWIYKEKGARHSRQFEQQIEWLRRMLDGSGDRARGDVVFDQFKNEAFRDRVYALSPQGKVIDLPEGATPLDFAYHIHTNLGHRCRGAKLNGQIVPLTTAIKNGDTVEILTQKALNPSRDWLNDHLGYLQSGRAKAKVRSYFKKLEKESSVLAGQEMFDRECRRLSLTAMPEDIQQLARHFNVHSVQDLFARIGFGEVGVLTVVHELAERLALKQQPEKPSLGERLARIPLKASRKQKSSSIEVSGVDDLMVNFASCCQPLPPVEITGFITQGRGINIHRSSCQNLQHLTNAHPERIIDVHWQEDAGGVYSLDLAVEAFDRPHLLRDISQILANEKVTIIDVEMEEDGRQRLKGTFTLEIADMRQLSRVIDRIAQVKNVNSVHRVKR